MGNLSNFVSTLMVLVVVTKREYNSVNKCCSHYFYNKDLDLCDISPEDLFNLFSVMIVLGDLVEAITSLLKSIKF